METEDYRLDSPTFEDCSISCEGRSLHVNPDVLRTLEALVQAAVTATPRPRLEIVGLLLGYEEYEGAELRLEAVHAITIEHVFGPSYQLSDSDIRLIEQTIGQLRGQFWLRTVGHFRSHSERTVKITAADRTIASLTGAPGHLVLLIQGSSMGLSLARLYRGSGEAFAVLLEFPLGRPLPDPPIPLDEDAREPSASGSPSNAIPRIRAETHVVAEPPVLQDPASLDPTRLGPRGKDITPPPPATRVVTPRPSLDVTAYPVWSKALALTGLLVFVVFCLLSSRPLSRGEGARMRLGLSVRESEGQIIVRWDPSRPAVRDGISGVLTIHDGALLQRVSLTPGQLRSGAFRYAPQTSTVEFQLAVYRDQLRHNDEILRFLTTPPERTPGQTAQDRTPQRPINRKERPGSNAERSLARSLRMQLHDSRPESDTPEASESSGISTPPLLQSSSKPEILPEPLVAQALRPPRIPDLSQIRDPLRLNVTPPRGAPVNDQLRRPGPCAQDQPLGADQSPSIDSGSSIY